MNGCEEQRKDKIARLGTKSGIRPTVLVMYKAAETTEEAYMRTPDCGKEGDVVYAHLGFREPGNRSEDIQKERLR